MRGYKILWEGKAVKINGSLPPPPWLIIVMINHLFISQYGKGKVQGQYCGFWHIFIRLKLQYPQKEKNFNCEKITV